MGLLGYSNGALVLSPSHEAAGHRRSRDDYGGTRVVAGRSRESIFREYASNVAAGLADAYSGSRKAE
jgi:hypothetical protein